MATRFSRTPCLPGMTISEVLFHFRSTVSREASEALEERDAGWITEIEALKSEYRTLENDHHQLLDRSRWMEEELSKQTCMRRSLEEDIESLSEKERWLQRRVRDLEAEVMDLGRTRKHEKVVLEDKVKEIDVMKKEICDFEYALGHVKLEDNDGKVRAEKQRRMLKASDVLDRIQVLEREKREIEAQLSRVKIQNSSEIEMIVSEKMTLETKNRRMEGEWKLLKRDMEAELRKASARSAEFERILNDKTVLEVENKRLEEEMKEKVSQFAKKYDVLEMEKGEIEDQLCQTLQEKVELGGYKSVMETELREMKAKISRLDKIIKEKTASEQRVRVLEQGLKASRMANKAKQHIIKNISMDKTTLEEKIYELVKKTEVLVRENQDMKAQVFKAKKDTQSECGRISKLKEDQKRRVEEAEKLVSEIKEALEAKEREKTQVINSLLKEKTEMEARFCQENKEKSEVIHMIAKEKMDLEAAKSTMEDEYEKKEKKLLQMIREKTEMEAKFCQENKEKSEAIKRISKEKTDLEAEKKTMEEDEKKKDLEFLKKTEVLKREIEDRFSQASKEKILKEKRTMEDEHKKKISDVLQNIEVLKREKRKLEEKLYQANREKSEEMARILKEKRSVADEHKKEVSELLQNAQALKRDKRILEDKLYQAKKEKTEEISRILKEKMGLEAEKRRIMEDEDKRKVLELNKLIEVLRRQKTEMEAQFCEANKEKSEEMKRILNENIAMQAEKMASKEEANKISELGNRIGILEREKRELETEIIDKDEVIKVIAEENSCLEEMKKKLEMEISGLKEEVHSSSHQPVNVGMLSEGKKSGVTCKRKRTNVCEHKGKRPHFSEGSIGGILNATSGGDVEDVSQTIESCQNRKPLPIWEVDQDLMNAFEGDPELCLKAICALYRQHLVLSQHGEGVFQPDYLTKAIVLAEYLVDDDRNGRLIKSVGEVEQLDPLVLVECINIAKQHYKQVFEIYKEKKDPLFLS